MRHLVPVAALLLLAGCHAPPPRTDKAQPLKDLGPKPAYTVSQAAVDRAIPVGVDAYVGWRITWTGGVPGQVVLERYVRGKCFARGRFRAASTGDFALSAIPAKAARTGGAVRKGMVLLADVLDGPAGRGQGILERNPLGHIALVYRVEKPAHPGGAPREVETRFHYQATGCVLPRVVSRGALPEKVRPAGLEAPSSGTGHLRGPRHGG